jgi:hypothetical protein
VTTEGYGEKVVQDVTSSYAGLDYESVKLAFQAAVDAAK